MNKIYMLLAAAAAALTMASCQKKESLETEDSAAAEEGGGTADAIKDGEPVHYAWKLAKVRVNEDEHIQLDYMGIDGGSTSFMADNNSEVTFTVNGVSHKAVFNPA